MLLFRQMFMDNVIVERPKFFDNIAIRLLLSLLVLYGLIHETRYFFSQLKTNDTTYILADFFCLVFTALLIVLLVIPIRKKYCIK